MKQAGISYFVEGQKEKWDNDKTIMEQGEKLPYDTRYDFLLKNLTLGKELGKGAFGEVVMAHAKGLVAGEPTTTVAVKRVKSPPKDEDIKALIAELKIMIHIGKHVNIVNILGVVREHLKDRKFFNRIIEYNKGDNCEFY